MTRLLKQVLLYAHSQRHFLMERIVLCAQRLINTSIWTWRSVKTVVPDTNWTQSSMSVNKNHQSITQPWSLQSWFSMVNRFLITSTRLSRRRRQGRDHVRQRSLITRGIMHVRHVQHQKSTLTCWEGIARVVLRIRHTQQNQGNVRVRLVTLWHPRRLWKRVWQTFSLDLYEMWIYLF